MSLPHNPNALRRAGLTLVELVVGVLLLAVLGASLLMASDSTSRAFRTGNAVTGLERIAVEGVGEIVERLEASALDLVLPVVSAPGSTDRLDYQRVLGWQAGAPLLGPPERIQLEYASGETDDGTDENGNGLVDECRVVWFENFALPGERRAVLCNWVAEALEGEELGDVDDDNGNGLIDERGLCFDFDGRRLTIRLTLERLDPDGLTITRTLERTIAFRDEEAAGGGE